MKKVQATATGFYKGARIYAGQAFAVPDELVGSWFKPVDGEKPKRTRAKKAQEPEAAPVEAVEAPVEEEPSAEA
jgi:hypothetical protein